jgi:hypothetical protein
MKLTNKPSKFKELKFNVIINARAHLEEGRLALAEEPSGGADHNLQNKSAAVVFFSFLVCCSHGVRGGANLA